MERYRRYKDSDVDWIGEIPEGWGVLKVKHAFINRDSERIPIESTQREQHDGGLYPYYGASGIVDRIDNYIFNETLILIGEDGANLKIRNLPLVYIATGKYWVNNHAHVLQPCSDIDLRYAAYQLELVDLHDYLTGSTQPKLTQENLGRIPFAVPSFTEQKAIADYLDEKTGAIDEAVARIERSIELLNEYRRSIISEAVTKGLDPTVPMKDSGIDWISQIPESWVVRRGKVLFQEVDERSETGNEELLTVSHITGVTPRSQKNVNMFMAESFEGYKKCRKDDIAANTMWLWQGAIGISPIDGIISPSYNVYRQRDRFYVTTYLDMLLRTPNLVETYRAHSSGITKSRLRLYPQEFLNIHFPVPPLEEQHAITDYLKKRVEGLDSLIAEKQSMLVRLREYRSALISECVTGKVKVPGVEE